jgi:hypothetical protein
VKVALCGTRVVRAELEMSQAALGGHDTVAHTAEIKRVSREFEEAVRELKLHCSEEGISWAELEPDELFRYAADARVRI